jgi:ParB-like chromosome segregation protein Spo0J
MSGETATLGSGFIPDSLLLPQLEAGPEAAISGQEAPILQIDSEFQHLIPPLTSSELYELRESLSTQGCREKLLVWKDHNILLDGHHRYTICHELGLDFEIREIELPSRDDVKIWIIKNQRSRRNLTPSQLSMLASELEAIYSEKAKENMGTRTDLGQDLVQGEGGRSAEKAAKDMGVSRQSVSFAKKVSAKGIPELVRRVASGDIAVSAASKIASLPAETQEKIMQAFVTDIGEANKPKIKNIIREVVPPSQETPRESDKFLEMFRKKQEANLKLLQDIESSQRPENLAALLAIVEKITARLREIEINSLDLLMHEPISADKDMNEFALLFEKSNKIKMFKGRSPLYAALKAFAQGHIDIRLREMGTNKVHKFTGEWKQAKMPEDAPSGMLVEIPKPYLKNEGVEILTPIQTLDDTDYELISILSHWQPIKYRPLLTKLRNLGWPDQYSTKRINRLIELNLIYMEKYKMQNGTLRAINVRKLTRNPFLSLTQTGNDNAKRRADTFTERLKSY